MSGKIKKALKEAEAKKQQAVDVNTVIPEDQKVKLPIDLHGKKPVIATKKASTKRETKTQPKVSIDFEAVKKQFSTIVKITQDKYGFTALRDPKSEAVLTYLVGRKDGKISHYVRSETTWKVSEVFKSQKQIDSLFNQVQKEISARKLWSEKLTPKYIDGDFITTSKSEMEAHLKSLL